MSQEQDIGALLAQLLGASAEPLTIVRLEFSPDQNGAFVLYDDKGNAYGGDGLQQMGTTAEQRAVLTEALEDGSMAEQFASYPPVDADVLKERLAAFGNWEVLYDQATA